jgi:crotonobetainyl-CoA:carnitine CoA-transferase CaiB-like acyl-CoA transferase
LSERLRQETTEAWIERLRGRVPCAPVRSLAEALDEDELESRDMLATYPHHAFNQVRTVSTPFTLAGYRPEYRAGPGLGGDCAAILAELDYSEGEVAALAAAGAFGGSKGSTS